MLLAICEKKLAIFASIGNYFRPSLQGCRGYGDPHAWVWVWDGYGDDLPSPHTRGDSMGIFNQPEITR